MTEPTGAEPAARDTARELLAAGMQLAPALRERILQFGERAIPALIEIVEDPGLALEDAPGEGWAPIHAVDLLGELEAAEAVEPLLATIAETEWDSIFRDRAVEILSSLGEPVLEPALRAYAASSDRHFRESMLSVLGGLGVRDERVYALLVEELADDVERGAINLGAYGDPRALELLVRAFDAQRVNPSEGPAVNHVFVELKASIEDLGGTLTLEQAMKLERALEPARRWTGRRREAAERPAPEPVQSREKLGRNDPCWCGSGQKFKRCHQP